jgi:hypothetical protein
MHEDDIEGDTEADDLTGGERCGDAGEELRLRMHLRG